MELTISNRDNGIQNAVVTQPTTNNAFIEANTIDMPYSELRNNHIIPVFARNNEPAISHAEFIDAVKVAAGDYFNESDLQPAVRVSHPIKGRIPSAMHKPAKDLLEHEKTLYYERMAFMLEIQGVAQEIDGSVLNLTVGGVKAFNQEKLYGLKGSAETFHVFVGFKNQVCTNLCIWTDGAYEVIKASSAEELFRKVVGMLSEYDAVSQVSKMERLMNYELTERQFAQLVGRCRLYNYLPKEEKRVIQPLLLSDTQINRVAETFYSDHHFSRGSDGGIDLWKLYNLFTGANKSSYIDGFLPRGVNCSAFVDGLAKALDGGEGHWFLN